MTTLEKILQEIDSATDKWGMVDCINDKPVIEKEKAKEIVKKHMTDDDGWISVEDRTPVEEYATVLCVTDKNHYFVGVFNEKFGFRTGDIDAEGKVIAWRPLPKPYKKDGE